MSDGFSQMIATSRGFFQELAANNTKEWFASRKKDYDASIQKPSELLAEIMAEELTRLTGKTHKGKVSRIHRDVRFSKDKSPYKTHVFTVWSPLAEGGPSGWILSISPEQSYFGTGLKGFEGDFSNIYRRFIDKHGDDVAETIADAKGAMLDDFGDAPLKRVPKPFAEDHPHGELLKRKNLCLTINLANGWDDNGVVAALQDKVQTLLPFWRLLNDELR